MLYVLLDRAAPRNTDSFFSPIRFFSPIHTVRCLYFFTGKLAQKKAKRSKLKQSKLICLCLRTGLFLMGVARSFRSAHC